MYAMTWCRSFLACALVLFLELLCRADTLQWTDPVNGVFSDPTNWKVVSGLGAPPPDAGDDVEFNQAGAYSVLFTQDALSDQLRVSNGDVTFLSDSATPREYTLKTGPSLANISGGSLQIGTPSNPLFLDLPNKSSGGGANASAIIIGSGADGFLTVDGPKSRLDGRIGQYQSQLGSLRRVWRTSRRQWCGGQHLHRGWDAQRRCVRQQLEPG